MSAVKKKIEQRMGISSINTTLLLIPPPPPKKNKQTNKNGQRENCKIRFVLQEWKISLEVFQKDTENRGVN